MSHLTIPPLLSSATKICNNAKEIVVYGFRSCGYIDIRSNLSKLSSELADTEHSYFKNVFDYTIGKPWVTTNTLNGKLTTIEFDELLGSIDICKATLVDIVFENYKRIKMNKEIIPVLFLIDKTFNENVTPLTGKVLASKEKEYNGLCTFKELRRAYKLCMEIADKELREVALKTFIPVKVIIKEENRRKFREGQEIEECVLERTVFPWADPGMQEAWGMRKEIGQKIRSETSFIEKQFSWRKQLIALKEEFLKSLKPVSSLDAQMIFT